MNKEEKNINNIKHDIESVDKSNTNKNTFLFEMFCEELPHSVQLHIENEWSKKANELLHAELQIEPLQKDQLQTKSQVKSKDTAHTNEDSTINTINKTNTKASNTNYFNTKTFSTPRRVAIQIENIPLTYNTPVEYRKGPKINANQSAIDAFISKYSSKYCSKNDEFWFYQKNSEEEKIQKILLKLCNQFAFLTTGPKMMKWSDKKSMWFRPVHSVVCMLNEEIIPFQYDNISSSNFTYGHRFFKNSTEENSTNTKPTEASSEKKNSIQEKKIFIENAKDYENILEKNKVIPCFQKRKEKILNQIQKISQVNSGSNSSDNSANNSVTIKINSLLDKITGLVEYPTTLTGCFDKSFLALPFEVIDTTLQNHQNAFAMYKNEELTNSFLFVTNALTNDYQLIISGNEKVVAARLSDANFFWNIDKNTSRNEYENRIQNKVYYDNLGSLKNKVNRMLKIAKSSAVQNIINKNNAENNVNLSNLLTAIEYSKYDLCSNLVREFPELQGVIGSYYYQYAQSKNDISECFSEEAKDAIKNSYNLHVENESNITKALVFIDNLDKIVCFFSINIFPTSSGDPFALRRSGNIIASILSKSNVTLNNLKNSINDICENSIKTFDKVSDKVSEKVPDKMRDNTSKNISEKTSGSSIHSFNSNSEHTKVIEFIFERIEKLAATKYNTKISFREIETLISLIELNTQFNQSNELNQFNQSETDNVNSLPCISGITTSFIFSILETISNIHSKSLSTCDENSTMQKISELSKRLGGLSEQMLSILLEKFNCEVEEKKVHSYKENTQQTKNDFEHNKEYIQLIKKLLQKFQNAKQKSQEEAHRTLQQKQKAASILKKDIINAIIEIAQSKNQNEYLFKYQNFILNYHDKVLKFLNEEDIITNNLQEYDINALNTLNTINSTDSEISLETEEKILIIIITNELYRLKTEFMLLLFSMTREI